MNLSLLVGLLALASSSGDGAETLRGKTLDEWRAVVEPRPSELAYAEIPWRPSFESALREAQAEERPILLWAMNGHPLGCT